MMCKDCFILVSILKYLEHEIETGYDNYNVYTYLDSKGRIKAYRETLEFVEELIAVSDKYDGD